MLSEVLHNNATTTAETEAPNMGSHQQEAKRFRGFLNRASKEFPHIVYVAGNHEFYHGKWCKGLEYLAEECSKYPNIYFLEDETKTIDDYTFIGCTLWTDMNGGDPLTLYQISDMMNDFSIIRDDSRGYTRLRPAIAAARHRSSIRHIQHVVQDKPDEKFVVVTHHAPTFKSIDPRYVRDTIMNGAYASDLSEFIITSPQIKMWCHGHIHHKQEYTVGETIIACNPRGYMGMDPRANEFQLAHWVI